MDACEMKTVVSYVSGCAGDFVVNCCNHKWNLPFLQYGVVSASASVKNQENELGNTQWLSLVNSFSQDYVGSHLVDRLLQLPVNPVWLVVPDFIDYRAWVRRDCLTRSYRRLLSRHGDLFEDIKRLILSNNAPHAAELYLDCLTDYNWAMMNMRLVQSGLQVDITPLLTINGVDSIINQLDVLKSVRVKCRVYHKLWLTNQQALTDTTVISTLAKKLVRFVAES